MCKGSSIVNVLIFGLFLVVMHTALAQADNRLSQLDAVTDTELILSITAS